MDKYEKAVAQLTIAGHEVYTETDSNGETGVWIQVWNSDLMDSQPYRLHENEIDAEARQYDGLKKERGYVENDEI